MSRTGIQRQCPKTAPRASARVFANLDALKRMSMYGGYRPRLVSGCATHSPCDTRLRFLCPTVIAACTQPGRSYRGGLKQKGRPHVVCGGGGGGVDGRVCLPPPLPPPFLLGGFAFFLPSGNVPSPPPPLPTFALVFVVLASVFVSFFHSHLSGAPFSVGPSRPPLPHLAPGMRSGKLRVPRGFGYQHSSFGRQSACRQNRLRSRSAGWGQHHQSKPAMVPNLMGTAGGRIPISKGCRQIAPEHPVLWNILDGAFSPLSTRRHRVGCALHKTRAPEEHPPHGLGRCGGLGALPS